MRNRIVLATTSVGMSIACALLLLAGIGWAAPASDISGSAEVNRVGAPAPAGEASIQAARRISVPFGIAATQQLAGGGKQVQVQGHAECWDESRMFDVRVRLAQSTTETFGEAHLIAICDQSADQQQWMAVASVESAWGAQAKFEAGPALACAQATEFGQHGIVDEHAWCKDVTLKAGY